ncbi:hypothetical protein LTR92_004190 [Exophiala xenobiotica]|nr:hypothetical protein LTR92_004190 [Exophiala xenobiotica]
MSDIDPQKYPLVFDVFAGYDPSLFRNVLSSDTDTNFPADIASHGRVFFSNVPDDSGTLSSDDPLKDLILRMFSETQKISSQARGYNTHPVVKMIVNFIQKNQTWQWKKGTVKQIMFPNINEADSPNDFTAFGLDDKPLRSGGEALTVKALYNGGGGNRDNFLVDRFNTQITSLNRYIDRNATSLYVSYFREAYGLTPSRQAVTTYGKLLLSPAYRQLKRAQLASPTPAWPNPDLEIYTHFVKLLACGATPTDIGFIYSVMCFQEPQIDPAAFPNITPSTWTSYRGWISSGLLDYGDLNGQNLTAHYTEHKPLLAYDKRYLADQYAEARGYWRNRPSSCCFLGDTLVVLEDGKTASKISELQEGVEVLSSVCAQDSTRQPRKVAFVSRPARAGRTMYSYKALPGITFTETHPFVVRNSTAKPLLSFVDADIASALNPTWQALRTSNITADALQTSPDIAGQEVVYDLVFGDMPENVAGPTTYFVQSSNGQQLETASEAPLISWFPHAARFYNSLIGFLTTLGADFNALSTFLKSDQVCCQIQLQETSLAAARLFPLAVAPTSPVTLQTLLGQATVSQRQPTADFLELLVSLLDRSINHEIHSGWMYVSDRSEPRLQQVLQLQLHSLSFLSESPAWAPECGKLHYAVTVNGNTLAKDSVPAERQGDLFWSFHVPLVLPNAHTGSALTSDLPDPPAEPPPFQVEVELIPIAEKPSSGPLISNATMSGQGPVWRDAPAKLLLGGLQNPTDTANGVFASLDLDIRIGYAPRPGLDSSDDQNDASGSTWGEKSQNKFAVCLAKVFAQWLMSASTDPNHVPALRKS